MFASPIPVIRRPSLRILPVAIALVVVYGLTGFHSLAAPTHWEAVAASSTIFMAFAAPYAALGAAMEASKLRRSQVVPAITVRGEFALLWDACRFPLVFGFVVQLVGLLFVISRSFDIPNLLPMAGVLSAWIVMLVLHVLVGYLFGRRMHYALAFPVSMLVSLVCLTFAWSTSWVQLRYLTGLVLSQCCDVDQSVSPAALLSVIVFSVITAIAFCVASISLAEVSWRRALGVVAAASIATSGFVTGIRIADDLGPYPATARSETELECRGNRPRICLFPEQKLGSNIDVIRSAGDSLARYGLPAPHTVIASRFVGDAPELVGFVSRPNFGENEQLRAFAAGYVQADHSDECLSGERGSEQMDLSETAIEVITGLLDPQFNPTIDNSLVTRFQHMNVDEQRVSVQELLYGVRNCLPVAGWKQHQ